MPNPPRDALKSARLLKGESQEKAGKRINRSQSTYAKIELGKVRLPYPDALKLSKAYGVPVEKLAPA